MFLGRFLYLVIKDIGKNLKKELLRMRVTRPMMRYRELNIIRELIAEVKPKKVLEWGSGYSTLYWHRLLPEDSTWLAVEHNKLWVDKLTELNDNPNVIIKCVEPENPDWTDKYRDGAYSDLSEYINYPKTHEQFDLIIIDGRGRKDCAAAAKDLITEKGIVILHDANREWYHEPLNDFKYKELFLDYRNNYENFKRVAGGIWLGSHETDINSVIDVNYHRKLWKYYNTKFSASLGL